MISEDLAREIADLGYPEVAKGDAKALALFIGDTVASLDTHR